MTWCTVDKAVHLLKYLGSIYLVALYPQNFFHTCVQLFLKCLYVSIIIYLYYHQKFNSLHYHKYKKTFDCTELEILS